MKEPFEGGEGSKLFPGKRSAVGNEDGLAEGDSVGPPDGQ